MQAHLLVCFLAYVLRKALEGWCRQAGLGSSVGTVLEEGARIQSTDVVVPTADGRTVRLRWVVRPDPAQAILLAHLGRTLPQRLRLPRGLVLFCHLSRNPFLHGHELMPQKLFGSP